MNSVSDKALPTSPQKSELDRLQSANFDLVWALLACRVLDEALARFKMFGRATAVEGP